MNPRHPVAAECLLRGRPVLRHPLAPSRPPAIESMVSTSAAERPWLSLLAPIPYPSPACDRRRRMMPPLDASHLKPCAQDATIGNAVDMTAMQRLPAFAWRQMLLFRPPCHRGESWRPRSGASQCRCMHQRSFARPARGAATSAGLLCETQKIANCVHSHTAHTTICQRTLPHTRRTHKGPRRKTVKQ